jgi:hypothetical protein
MTLSIIFRQTVSHTTRPTGVSVATQILDNALPFPSSAQKPPPAVSPPADADLKRLTYRALMLRGMACHQVESKPPSENQRDSPRATPCDTSRQMLRDVMSGRISDAVAFEAAVDRSLQQLALSQVVTTPHCPIPMTFGPFAACSLVFTCVTWPQPSTPGRICRTPHQQPWRPRRPPPSPCEDRAIIHSGV